MSAQFRVVCAAALLAFAAKPLTAQGSAYFPLDDPRLPLLEHLITRGDVEDPSPMVRPFRFADALRVLAAADTAPTRRAGRLIQALRAELAEDTAGTRWSFEVRLGGQAYTQKRRDPLHLGGPGAINPYLDGRLEVVLGKLVLASRPAVEPSLIGDPDWPNRAQENVTGRLIEGYLSAQFKFASLTYGQLERNWGPVGLPGISLSNYAYQRQGLALAIGTRDLRLDALASDLTSEVDSLGQFINRYLIVHRLGARLTSKLQVAGWESIIIAGPGRVLETPFANPLSLSVLANTFGIRDLESNEMFGADLQWRLLGRTTLQAQIAIDDFLFNTRQTGRDRWAFTLSLYGPLGSDLAWRSMYTQVSSLALRTANPLENFTDAGVGTGRNFSDMDQLTLAVMLPFAGRFLLSPQLVFQRQGEGRINDPYPTLDANGVLPTPALFIGTVERTYRIGLGIDGRSGPFDLSATAGFNHVVNSENQAGVTANRFVGRVQATLGWRRRGRLR